MNDKLSTAERLILIAPMRVRNDMAKERGEIEGQAAPKKSPQKQHKRAAQGTYCRYGLVVILLLVGALFWFYFSSLRRYYYLSTSFGVVPFGSTFSAGPQQARVARPSGSAFSDISGACRGIPDTRNHELTYLSEVLRVKGDLDEWGAVSAFIQPVTFVKRLMADGHIPAKDAPDPSDVFPKKRSLYAVNFGARDGKGGGGNTDPTYPIFKELGFRGMAVEASPSFWMQLTQNLNGLPVRPVKSFITVDNAVSLIKKARLPFVDVFKIDIDSFDCDVIPRVLREYTPAVVIAEVCKQ